jgi:hypothetical protein
MFDFKATSELLGDCTMWYDVSCNGNTVGDLIDYVLTARRQEWGEINVIPKEAKWLESEYELEYSKGKIIKSNIPDTVKSQPLLKVDANGGWSSMSYFVWVDIEKKGRMQ